MNAIKISHMFQKGVW